MVDCMPPASKPLTILLAAILPAPALLAGDSATLITGISADSRRISHGMLFAAIAGAQGKGADYVADALSRGAAALLLDANDADAIKAARTLCNKQQAIIVTDNPRLALAQCCAAFWPLQPKHLVAVTGTNGKTSVAEFYRQIAANQGFPAASIGTLGLTLNEGMESPIAWQSGNTSPAPELLHEALDALARAGVQHVAIEASSHGLHQYRLHGAKLTATAFTNLTQDHLDYHPDMEAYFQAKALLFTDFPHARSTINADDAYGKRLLADFPNAASYGMDEGMVIQCSAITPTASGLNAHLSIAGEGAELALPIYGAFQLQNIMAAAGLALFSGLDARSILSVLPTLKGVRGRMEKVGQTIAGAPIFVDYAHTPDALKHLLETLRTHCDEKLHVVFGCGGDRDKGKRAPMGRIAAEHADKVIITDDNPRSEDPNVIRRQIKQGAPNAIEIPDRADAIRQAMKQLGAGDVLVVAGKGHETTQIIGDTQLYFNDAQQIQEALGAL
jgi:UDP-N-acetylmuramoyl-L-alanyl-D-glutamate--2,6-diaminopimelate ligase